MAGTRRTYTREFKTEAVRRVVEENPEAAARYRAGKVQLLEFFVGQVMKATAGKADPRRAQSILTSLLGSKHPPE